VDIDYVRGNRCTIQSRIFGFSSPVCKFKIALCQSNCTWCFIDVKLGRSHKGSIQNEVIEEEILKKYLDIKKKRDNGKKYTVKNFAICMFSSEVIRAVKIRTMEGAEHVTRLRNNVNEY
jgi:wyosine [tRNA(Phe)-imidazoG37] synthetase (radical SAM superfamily)